MCINSRERELLQQESECLGYHVVKEFRRYVELFEYRSVTDRRTDRQTQTDILRQHSLGIVIQILFAYKQNT